MNHHLFYHLRKHTGETIHGSMSGRIDEPPLAELWADDLLTTYARGIAACQDLYYNGSPHQVEAILPLYSQPSNCIARSTDCSCFETLIYPIFIEPLPSVSLTHLA